MLTSILYQNRTVLAMKKTIILLAVSALVTVADAQSLQSSGRSAKEIVRVTCITTCECTLKV